MAVFLLLMRRGLEVDYDSILEGADVAAVTLVAVTLTVMAVALFCDGCSRAQRHIAAAPERRKTRRIERMRLLLLDFGQDEQGAQGGRRAAKSRPELTDP